MTAASELSSFVIALAWLAMGTVLAIWMLTTLWRGGHRVVAWIRGARS
jgi:hypothetical protein